MESKKSAFSVALKYALITGLISFIYSIILYMLNQSLNQALSWVVYLIFLAGVILTIKERRNKDLGGNITYGQGFSAGFLYSLLTAVVAAVTTYLMFSVIAPDLVGQMLRQSEQKMLDKGMSTEQVDLAMNYTEKFMTPVMMVVWSIAGTIVIGTIFSLIVAAIMRREPANLQQPR